MCMPRYMKIHPYSSYQIACQTDNFELAKFELAKMEITRQMYLNEDMLPKIDMPYYCDIRDGVFYIRHLMMAPREEILLEIYSDRFLVLL